MCGWLLLKEEPTVDKVSHLTSEVTSGWQKCRSSGDSCSLCAQVSLICPVAGGPLLLVSASQLKSRYDPLQGGVSPVLSHALRL